MSKTEDNKKNIDKLYDLYYKATKNIESIVTKIINSMGVMKKSDYATNEQQGVVDKANSATCGDNNTIKFGIDANGKWGYIKDDGADTVIPFKSANLQANKNITPTTQQQIILPDSGYDGMEQATVSAIRLQTVSNVQPGSAVIIITPDSGYDGLRQVSIDPAPGATLQTKTTTVTPGANWSGSETASVAIIPDSGYDGMSQVNVKTPMIRDYCLVTPLGVDTPGTVYNGDTSQSNSQQLLRVAPTKTGMAYTNSYLYMQPSSHLGNATTGDVRSGKTFSSSDGIQKTGTWSGEGSSLQNYKDAYSKTGGSMQTISPDSGYDGLQMVRVYPLDYSGNPNVVTLWTGNGSGATAVGSFTASLSSSYKSYTYIRIWFRSNRSYATEFCWMDSVEHIDAVNDTSTNMFAISCRSIASSGQTSGNVFARTFRFSGNTSMAFNTGTQVTSGSGSTNSNVCIPYKIEGIY